MRVMARGNNSKSSWPKTVARKWLNIQSGADEFHSDYEFHEKSEKEKSCSDKDRCVVVPEDFSERLVIGSAKGPPKFTAETPPGVCAFHNLRMFVGTWNVGGNSPQQDINLKDWLGFPSPADIYVLGFQEIVPLNAGNVLGAEDNGPAAKWLTLIRQALNKEDDANIFQVSPEKPRPLFSNLLGSKDEPNWDPILRPGQYSLVASKQMVGIFLCVWVRSELCKLVRSVKVSCVGRGIMGYLGNKGSISISMTLQKTSFCFVCTHLTSGGKEGDEVRRNSDVVEILKKTKFSHSCSLPGGPVSPPETILDHDKIIWLGDLNYRLTAACSSDTFELLRKRDWQSLLEKDQLRIEQKAGRIFEGWEEGRICFAPTYKYLTNSEHYVVQNSKSRNKRHTPAWCDRILWKGEGMKQMWYVRYESKFSDHRPVHSLFSVQVA